MNKIIKCICTIMILTSIVAYSSGNTMSDCCAPCCDTYDCCYNCNECCLGQCDGYPYLQIRSQGRDSARGLVGWQQFINRYDMEKNYYSFSLAVEYERSFRPERTAHFLFGNDLINGCELLLQGNTPCENVPAIGGPATKNPKAWFVNYFGLPTNYSSKVTFCPTIQNVVIDFNFYWGLDCWRKGLYVKMNAPLVWTKWELCMHERIICPGKDDLPIGYMAEEALDRTTQMPASFTQYIAGNATFGDMKSPLNYGIINNCSHSKTRLAELDVSLGYNFYLEEDYNFGAFFYIAAPTGNRPCAKYLFEPIVGNGKHWELGGGISGSWIFSRNCDCPERYFGMWFDATIAHLFKSRQCRSFDFCGKANSRYMLLAEMGTNTDLIKLGQTSSAATANDYQYKKNLIPAINWSTFNLDVKIPIQADIAVKLGYIRDNWTFDLGYNFYARTGEKFCDCCPSCDGKQYTIKGDSYLYGRPDLDGAPTYPLPVSESEADIHAGTNWPQLTNDDNPRLNPRVDNPTLAWTDNGDAILSLESTTAQMNGSKDPLFVSRNQLNLGKSPSMITHKFFAHVGYAWDEKSDCECNWNYIPCIGVGCKVEFAQDNWNDCYCGDCNSVNCSSCNTKSLAKKSCAKPSCGICSTMSCSSACNNQCCCNPRGGINTWGAWIKGGIYFD